MNSKFEGQNTDLDSKISSLKESVNKVPTKIEFEKVCICARVLVCGNGLWYQFVVLIVILIYIHIKRI
jgi:hypothetical protein